MSSGMIVGRCAADAFPMARPSIQPARRLATQGTGHFMINRYSGRGGCLSIARKTAPLPECPAEGGMYRRARRAVTTRRWLSAAVGGVSKPTIIGGTP